MVFTADPHHETGRSPIPPQRRTHQRTGPAVAPGVDQPARTIPTQRARSAVIQIEALLGGTSGHHFAARRGTTPWRMSTQQKRVAHPVLVIQGLDDELI
ncbi:MAG: hypothetical protein ACRES5_34485, partial [Pseudomonas sp.]